MSATPKIRNRIAKLLRLAESPVEAEAASALEEAERLLKKHGLTREDFEEDVIEVADNKRDDLRQRLAYAVGVSRRCVCNKKHDIRFRGKSSDVQSAVKLYKELVHEVDLGSDIGDVPHRDLWRICFWFGFVEVVTDRLIDDEVRAWRPPEQEAPKPSEVEVMGPPPVISDEPEKSLHEQMQEAADNLAQAKVEEVRRGAREAGKRLGAAVRIESRKRPQQPMLDDGGIEIVLEVEDKEDRA